MKKVILKRHFFAEKFGGFKKKHYLCTRFRTNTSTGEMVEWSITVVLKTTVPRGTGGSNPSLSAENILKGINQVPFFHAWYSTRYLYNMLIVNVLENRNF